MSISRHAEIKFDTTAPILYVKGLVDSKPEQITGFSLYPARPVSVAAKYGVIMAKNGTAWAVGRTVEGLRMAWKTVKIDPVYAAQKYRLRSVAGGYKGDYVTRWSRKINGRRIDFVRIAWNGGKGGTEVRAEDNKTGKIIHEFHYPAK